MADWPARRLEASIDIRNARICSLLIRLAEEAEYPGFAGVAMAEGLAMQIAVTLERHLRDLADPAPEGGLATWRMNLIDDRLRDLAKAPGLGELALLCRLSVRQLSRGFRTSRGLSIGQYIAEQRAEGAKRLLTGGASVKEVAFALGFNSPSSFCVAFKKATSITPSQYRVCS